MNEAEISIGVDRGDRSRRDSSYEAAHAAKVELYRVAREQAMRALQQGDASQIGWQVAAMVEATHGVEASTDASYPAPSRKQVMQPEIVHVAGEWKPSGNLWQLADWFNAWSRGHGLPLRCNRNHYVMVVDGIASPLWDAAKERLRGVREVSNG